MEKAIHSKEYALVIQRLKKARRDAGLTQGEAAKRLDRTQSYISKVENGELRLDIIGLKQFAKIYKKDISHFL